MKEKKKNPPEKKRSRGELGGGECKRKHERGAYLDIFFDLNGTHGVGRVV